MCEEEPRGRRKPPLPCFSARRAPETWAPGESVDCNTHDAKAAATVARDRWQSPREEIVVREEDFRRYGSDLAKLRKCQVPKGTWEAPPKNLSKKERFEQSCRLAAELRDPWCGLENPETTRAAAEKDITLNQRWVREASSAAVEQKELPRRRRSQSEEVQSHKKRGESGERRESFVSNRRLRQPVEDTRTQEEKCSEWELLENERIGELRRLELMDWVHKIEKPAITRSADSRSTSARRHTIGASTCSADSRSTSARSHHSRASSLTGDSTSSLATSKGVSTRSRSREQPSAPLHLRGDRPPRAPGTVALSMETGYPVNSPALSALEAQAPTSARRARSGSGRPLRLSSARDQLPPLVVPSLPPRLD